MMKFKLFQNKPKNWILKAVSLCLAIMLWYFVVGEDQVDMKIQVPIEIINLPANLTIANEYKKNIDVAVRGPRSVILDLRNRNITRPVDLSSAQPGTIVIKNDERLHPPAQGHPGPAPAAHQHHPASRSADPEKLSHQGGSPKENRRQGMNCTGLPLTRTI